MIKINAQTWFNVKSLHSEYILHKRLSDIGNPNPQINCALRWAAAAEMAIAPTQELHCSLDYTTFPDTLSAPSNRPIRSLTHKARLLVAMVTYWEN